MIDAKEKDEILRTLPTGPPTATGHMDVYHPIFSEQLENFFKHKYRLEDEGYIGTKKGGTDDSFALRAWRTAKGRDFIEHGGYTALKIAKQQEIKRKKNAEIWEKANIIIAFLALSVSIYTSYNSNQSSNELSENWKEQKRIIDTLKLQMRDMRDSIRNLKSTESIESSINNQKVRKKIDT